MLKNLQRLFLVIMCLCAHFTYANERLISVNVASKILNEERQIQVSLPTSYDSNSDISYPVLYVLDGEWNLAFFAGMLNRMHLSEAAPEYIVVGINNTNRVRDLTPTVNVDPRGPVGEGGGGDTFLDFIESELIPLMNKSYRTTDFKVLAGHSIGGLLVLHSFQSRPQLFQAHFAFSPAVWWGGRETLQATKRFIKTKPLLDNYLYLNIGNEGGEMRQVYDDLHQTILKFQTINLEFSSDAFDQPHGLTIVAGLFNACRNLFKYQQNN
jgi:predicted alpha/beta superfamily hydrolase